MTVNVQARAERQDTSLEPDTLPATEVFTAPLIRQLGNYLLIGESGRGGFGVVWEAERVEQQYGVVPKTLPSVVHDRLNLHDAADRLRESPLATAERTLWRWGDRGFPLRLSLRFRL